MKDDIKTVYKVYSLRGKKAVGFSEIEFNEIIHKYQVLRQSSDTIMKSPLDVINTPGELLFITCTKKNRSFEEHTSKMCYAGGYLIDSVDLEDCSVDYMNIGDNFWSRCSDSILRAVHLEKNCNTKRAR